jgi:DNA polymerase III alpha subunit
MLSKICHICKQKFITSSEHKRLCSIECKEIAYKQQHNLASSIYRNKNRKIINNNHRLRYRNNPNERKEYHKRYHLLNKIRIAEYRLKNKSKIAKRCKIYINEKRKNDLNFKLRDILRRRIWNALKNNIKSAKTIELLGCSIEFLKLYLESNFTPGMNWENYGKWHVDHIVPCAKFDLENSESQFECFHYTNLQPLWAKDNLKKGSR